MEIVNFPFIIQYARAFKDNCDVYFLVEFVKGMELFDVIRDIGKYIKIHLIYQLKQIFFYLFNIEIYLIINYFNQIGLLNTYDSQFYVASMILILEYLHH